MLVPILQAAVPKNIPPPLIQDISEGHQRELLQGDPKQMVQSHLGTSLNLHQVQGLQVLGRG